MKKIIICLKVNQIYNSFPRLLSCLLFCTVKEISLALFDAGLKRVLDGILCLYCDSCFVRSVHRSSTMSITLNFVNSKSRRIQFPRQVRFLLVLIDVLNNAHIIY